MGEGDIRAVAEALQMNQKPFTGRVRELKGHLNSYEKGIDVSEAERSKSISSPQRSMLMVKRPAAR